MLPPSNHPDRTLHLAVPPGNQRSVGVSLDVPSPTSSNGALLLCQSPCLDQAERTAERGLESKSSPGNSQPEIQLATSPRKGCLPPTWPTHPARDLINSSLVKDDSTLVVDPDSNRIQGILKRHTGAIKSWRREHYKLANGVLVTYRDASMLLPLKTLKLAEFELLDLPCPNFAFCLVGATVLTKGIKVTLEALNGEQKVHWCAFLRQVVHTSTDGASPPDDRAHWATQAKEAHKDDGAPHSLTLWQRFRRLSSLSNESTCSPMVTPPINRSESLPTTLEKERVFPSLGSLGSLRRRAKSDPDLVVNPDSNCIQGVLKRRTGPIKIWRKQYYKLSSGMLFIYRNASMLSQVGMFDLDEFQLCDLPSRKCAFYLVGISAPTKGIKIRLKAFNAEQKAHWCAYLHRVVHTNTGDMSPPAATDPSTCRPADRISKTKLSEFSVVRPLGEGFTGTVMQVKHEATGRKYAVKRIQKSTIMQAGLHQAMMIENKILRHIKHPNIVVLHHAFNTVEHLYLLMDCHSEATIATLVRQWVRLPQARAKFYCGEVALALKHLHSFGIIHRDLKMTNVLLSTEGHAILTDFGTSTYGVDNAGNSFCGTLAYLAPEMVNREPCNEALDWWALGVMLYWMITGDPPFTSTSTQGEPPLGACAADHPLAVAFWGEGNPAGVSNDNDWGRGNT